MIMLRVKQESDLYSKFDPSQTRLSGDCYSYLKTCIAEAPAAERKNQVLRIEAETPMDAEKAKAAIRLAVERDVAELDRKLKENHMKMIRLYVIGIALIVAGFALALTLDKLILEVISIVGSMAVKDAATIQIEHNPELRYKKRMIRALEDMQVEVVQG